MKQTNQTNNRSSRRASVLALLTGLLVCTATLTPGQKGYSQTGWQPSKANPKVAAAGGLGVSKTTSMLSAGDQISGTSNLTLIAPFDVTIHFSGFGDPGTVGVSPFQMSLQFEVSGIGTLYSGPAKGINGLTVTLPTSTNAQGIGLKLARVLTVLRNVPAGTYTDQGQITVTQI